MTVDRKRKAAVPRELRGKARVVLHRYIREVSRQVSERAKELADACFVQVEEYDPDTVLDRFYGLMAESDVLDCLTYRAAKHHLDSKNEEESGE